MHTCQAGACQGGTPLTCDDGVDCTVDTCDPVAGCLHVSACDAGPPDADRSDAPADSAPDGLPDAEDAAATDAAAMDTAAADAAATDTATTDTARPVADARPDTRKADAADAAAAPSSGGGCGCRTAGADGTTPLWAALAVLGLIAVARPRRRRRSRPD